MTDRAHLPKPTGKFIMRCLHGVPFSAYYYTNTTGSNREQAQNAIERFRISHLDFAPDCALAAKIEEIVLEPQS